MQQSKKKSWVDCGYLTLSKKGTVLSIVVKHQRFIANLKEALEVLSGNREYTLIFEHVRKARQPSLRSGSIQTKQEA